MDTYEKKYNEAVLRADEAVQKGCLDKDIFDIIFPPEESEDEKVRKCLIAMVNTTIWDSSNLASKKACLAWLEKQKDDRMKPIYDARESFESALEKAWNDYHNGYENVDKLEDDYVECAHAKGFREGYLFGIEKQKEQKPAEWSEEDEKKRQRIIKVIEAADSDWVLQKAYGPYGDLINWLKSLRPSWKPSKEQMEALESAVKLYKSTHFEIHHEKIVSLYEQLKKL